MAITGPNITPHAPPVMQAQVIQGPQSRPSMFQQMLGGMVGSGFEHLMRNWLPTPQDEVARAQAGLIKNQNIKGIEDELRNYAAEAERAEAEGKTQDAQHIRQLIKSKAEAAGMDPSLVHSNEQTRIQQRAAGMRETQSQMDENEAQGILNKYTQTQPQAPSVAGGQQTPATPQPVSYEQQAGVTSNPYDFGNPQQPVQEPSYNQNFVGPRQETVQQAPEVQKMQDVSSGFHSRQPQPQNFTQDDRLRYESAMTRLQNNAQMIQYLNKGQGDLITPEMRDLASQGVDAFSELARFKWEKEGVAPEWSALLNGSLITQGISAYQAFTSGKDPEGKAVKAFDQYLDNVAKSNPQAFQNPNAVSRFKQEAMKVVMQGAPALSNILKLDQINTNIGTEKLTQGQIVASTAATMQQIEVMKQEVANARINGQLKGKELANWDAMNETEQATKYAQIALLKQQSGLVGQQINAAKIAAIYAPVEKYSEVVANFGRAISNISTDQELTKMMTQGVTLAQSVAKLNDDVNAKFQAMKSLEVRGTSPNAKQEDVAVYQTAYKDYQDSSKSLTDMRTLLNTAEQGVSQRMQLMGNQASPVMTQLTQLMKSGDPILKAAFKMDPATGELKFNTGSVLPGGKPLSPDWQAYLQGFIGRVPAGTSKDAWLNSKTNTGTVKSDLLNGGFNQNHIDLFWQQVQQGSNTK